MEFRVLQHLCGLQRTVLTIATVLGQLTVLTFMWSRRVLCFPDGAVTVIDLLMSRVQSCSDKLASGILTCTNMHTCLSLCLLNCCTDYYLGSSASVSCCPSCQNVIKTTNREAQITTEVAWLHPLLMHIYSISISLHSKQLFAAILMLWRLYTEALSIQYT